MTREQIAKYVMCAVVSAMTASFLLLYWMRR